jgi:hypothetical protein
MTRLPTTMSGAPSQLEVVVDFVLWLLGVRRYPSV